MTDERQTLEHVATALGENLAELLPRVVEEEGSIHKAAVRLGVWPNSIRNWMSNNGYQLKSRRIARLEKTEAKHD